MNIQPYLVEQKIIQFGLVCVEKVRLTTFNCVKK
jgi:hypothetical protein